jgi:hypothetical protein
MSKRKKNIEDALSLIVQRFKDDDVSIVEKLHTDPENTNVIYRAYKDEKEIAIIQLMISDNATIASYTNNEWFGSRSEKNHDAILVKWITSNKKGYGSLMLAYGVLMMKRKYSKINYSILDDDSAGSIYKTKNIYSKFGYTPLYKVTHKAINNGGPADPNEISLGGPEKQVLISEFLKKVFEQYTPNRNSRSTRNDRSAKSARSHQSAQNDRSHQSAQNSRSAKRYRKR